MTDNLSKKKRSYIMSQIRSRDTKVEKIIFRELQKRKIYFQKNYNRIAGSPDIALPKKKRAIFIDGDFWHGYQFPKLKKRLPNKFWKEKIRKNIRRDKLYRSRLKRAGWKILRIWEHQIKNDFGKTTKKILHFLKFK